LIRESEELNTLEHAYSHKGLRFVVHLCTWLSGEPQPLESQQFGWVRPEQLGVSFTPPTQGSLRRC
jgi:A/G-specific adenine glycosylase